MALGNVDFFARDTRPTNDFFGPTYDVKFYALSPTAPQPQDDGAVVQQKTPLTQDQLDALAIQNFVSSLTVEAFTGMMKCEVVLTPPFQDALTILGRDGSPSAIQFNAVMGIKWGYTDQNLLTKEHLFTIIHPRVSFGRDITISITGIDTMSNGLKRQCTRNVISRDLYPQDILVLTDIADQYGFIIDRTYAPEASDPRKPAPIDAVKTTPISSFNNNDWLLFKSICQENDLNFYIGSGNIIYLSDHSYVQGTSTDYTFFWYDQPRTSYDIPMISFTTNVIPSIFTQSSAIAQGLLTTSVHPDDNTPKVQKIDQSSPGLNAEGDPKTDQTAAGTDQQQSQPTKTEDSTVTPLPAQDSNMTGGHSPRPGRAPSKDKQLVRESMYTVNTTAQIVAPGHPDVIPPRNIWVENVGPFSGGYLLISSKHVLNQSGYEMTLQTVRTTTPGEMVFGNPVVEKDPQQGNQSAPSSGASQDSTKKKGS